MKIFCGISQNISVRLKGFSLIELMISMLLGLLLVFVVGRIYLSSKATYRLTNNNSRMQEEVQVAFGIIGDSLMQAGYGNIQAGDTTDFNKEALKGCDQGFSEPPNDLSAFDDCTQATENDRPWFSVSYRTDDISDKNRGLGVDCNGYNASKGTAANGTVINHFFVAKNLKTENLGLYCVGNGNPPTAGTLPAHLLLDHVVAMQVKYGVDTTGEHIPTRFLDKASEVDTLPPNKEGKSKWEQVMSVNVCIEVRSANKVADVLPSSEYTNCQGNKSLMQGSFFYKTFSHLFTLRNRTAPPEEVP